MEYEYAKNNLLMDFHNDELLEKIKINIEKDAVGA